MRTKNAIHVAVAFCVTTLVMVVLPQCGHESTCVGRRVNTMFAALALVTSSTATYGVSALSGSDGAMLVIVFN